MFPQRNCTSLHCYYFPIRVYCHVLFHTGLYLGFAAKMKNRFAKIQHFRKISVSRKYFPEMRNFRKNIFLEYFIFASFSHNASFIFAKKMQNFTKKFAKFSYYFQQRFIHFREKIAKFHEKVSGNILFDANSSSVQPQETMPLSIISNKIPNKN